MAKARAIIEEGSVFTVEYPFYRENDMWIPGEGDGELTGLMVLSVIAIHRFAYYQDRIFYIREWEGPDGSKFGDTKLRCTAISHFRKLLSGYKRKAKPDPSSLEIKCKTFAETLGVGFESLMEQFHGLGLKLGKK